VEVCWLNVSSGFPPIYSLSFISTLLVEELGHVGDVRIHDDDDDDIGFTPICNLPGGIPAGTAEELQCCHTASWACSRVNKYMSKERGRPPGASHAHCVQRQCCLLVVLKRLTAVLDTDEEK